MPMPTLTPSRRFLALAGAALIATVWSCGREVTGPGTAPVRDVRGLSFNTAFPTAYQQAAGAGLVSFTTVHIVLHHADGSMALDTVVAYPTGADSLTLTLSVPLLASAPVGGEPMALTLGYLNAAGETVFRGGPVTVTVAPRTFGSPAPAPVTVPVAYSGVGSTAARVVIAAPTTRALNIGDAFAFTATAQDAAGATLAGTPIVWTTANAAVATLPSAAAGAGTAVARGTARIVAQLLTGQTDTATVTVTALPGTISAQSGSAQSAVITAPLAAPLVARVLGTDNLPLGGASVTFAVATGGGHVTNAVVMTDGNGLAQTTWTLGPTVGAQSVTAAVAGVAAMATFTATGTVPPAERLAFTTPPATQMLGAAPGAIVVQAQDNAGHPAVSFSGPITLALGSGPAGATLSGTTTVAAVAGSATFTGVAPTVAGTGYTLTAASSGLVGATSPAFEITAGAATQLVFAVSPGTTPIDVVLAPTPTVEARDVAGNLATSFTGTVTLALAANPAGGTLLGGLRVAAVAGVARFPAVALPTAGNGYVLSASADGLTSATSAAFSRTPGAPATLTIVSGGGQTGAISSALAQPIVVQVTDAVGDLLRGETVTFTAANGGSAAPATTTTDANGRAQTTWTLGSATGAQSLVVSGPRLTAIAKSVTTTATSTPPVTVTGRVYDFATNLAVAAATITPVIDGTAGAAVASDAGGNYSFGVHAGAVVSLTIVATGYVTVSVTAQTITAATTLDPTPLVSSSPNTGTISGAVLDATNSSLVVSGATVELRTGMGNTTGQIARSTATNESGQYAFTGLPAGVYTIRVTALGYSPGARTGITVGGASTSGQDIQLSPALSAGQWRIVLTWGSSPSDLDSHLTVPLGGSSRSEIAYYARGNCLSPTAATGYACLDQDVTDHAYNPVLRPETITITQLLAGSTYRYYVHNYSSGGQRGTTTFGASGAQVNVYNGSALVATYNVPHAAGNLWSVFTLTDGVLTPVNSLADWTNGALAGASLAGDPASATKPIVALGLP